MLMVEEGLKIERPQPGARYEVEGKSGKIEVHHWHVGDDVRISLYNQEGNSVYFVTNKKGAKEWADALKIKEEGDIAKIKNNRGVAEMTRIGNRVVVEAYDELSPGHRTRASFDEEQAKNVRIALGFRE
jgi:hypothetical protein